MTVRLARHDLVFVTVKVVGTCDAKKPHKHKDPTNQGFWNPPPCLMYSCWAHAPLPTAMGRAEPACRQRDRQCMGQLPTRDVRILVLVRPAILAVVGDLKGSFVGDIDIDIDTDVDVDVDRCFGCVKGVSKSAQVF